MFIKFGAEIIYRLYMLLPSQGGLLHGIGIGKVKLPLCSINHYTIQVYGEKWYGTTHN